ncbi:MAG: hypothetical protein ACFCU3_05490, partial [Verrucomicrobiales bacterium]
MDEATLLHLSQLHRSSLEDVRISRDSAVRTQAQHDRRNFVRSVFAMIEVSSFLLKMGFIAFASQRGIELEKKDVDKLKVEVWHHAGLPEAAVHERSLSLVENFKYSLAAFARIQGRKYEGPKDQDIKLFEDAQKVRNRITHPKTPNDFTISDGDFQSVDKLCEWYIT